MGRWMEGEAGLVALLAWADGTCQGFEPVLERGGVEVEDLLSLTHTLYLTGLIFIHTLWRVSSDVSKGEESWNWEQKDGALVRFEKRWEEKGKDDERRGEQNWRQEDMRRGGVDVKGTGQLGSAMKVEERDG